MKLNALFLVLLLSLASSKQFNKPMKAHPSRTYDQHVTDYDNYRVQNLRYHAVVNENVVQEIPESIEIYSCDKNVFQVPKRWKRIVQDWVGKTIVISCGGDQVAKRVLAIEEDKNLLLVSNEAVPYHSIFDDLTLDFEDSSYETSFN